MVYTYYSEPETYEDPEGPDGPQLSDSASPDVTAPTVGLCGYGTHYQVAIQKTTNPRFELLVTSPKGQPNHWPELEDLAKKVNKQFQKDAEKLLARKRDQTGIKELEITVVLSPDGLQLCYARAAPRKKRAPVPRKTFFTWWNVLWHGRSKKDYEEWGDHEGKTAD